MSPLSYDDENCKVFDNFFQPSFSLDGLNEADISSNMEEYNTFIKRNKQIPDFFLNAGYPRNLFEGKRVLDAGGGTGNFAICSKYWGAAQVVLVDQSIKAITIAEKKIELLKITSIKTYCLKLDKIDQLPEKEFDFIFCNGVLHHVKNLKEILPKLASLLSPSGIFSFTHGLFWLSFFNFHLINFITLAVFPNNLVKRIELGRKLDYRSYLKRRMHNQKITLENFTTMEADFYGAKYYWRTYSSIKKHLELSGFNLKWDTFWMDTNSLKSKNDIFFKIYTLLNRKNAESFNDYNLITKLLIVLTNLRRGGNSVRYICLKKVYSNF